MAFYKENIVDINLNTGNIFRSFLNHSIGYKDDDADRFGIRAFRDGEPVDLSGASCQAIFMNPNGTNIALTSYGTVSGNVAYVTLPPACYDYEGQFCLAIKLVGGGVTGTVRIVDGMVINTGASGTVSPTSAVPTYQEILSTYDAMVAATSAANLAIAETFDATKAYPAGKYVINDGHLYRLTADHAANVTWANTSKVATNFGDDLSSLKSAISDITGNSIISFIHDKYIITTGNIVDVTDIQDSGLHFMVAVVDASEGDKFTLNGTGGSSGLLWCFVSSSGTRLTHSAAGATANDLVITAPENSSKLVINLNQNGGLCYTGEYLPKRVSEIDNAIINIDDALYSRINYFDKDANGIIENKYIGTDGSDDHNYSSSFISDYIPCQKGDIISFDYSGTYGDNFKLYIYDSSKNYLDYCSVTTQDGISWTKVDIDNAAYCRFNCLKEKRATAMLCKGYGRPAQYVAYDFKFITMKSGFDQIDGMNDEIDGIKEDINRISVINLFNKNDADIDDGHYINANSSGSIDNLSTGFISGYMPCKKGDAISFTNKNHNTFGGNFALFLFDSNKTFLNFVNVTQYDDYAKAIVDNDNAAWFRINQKKDNKDIIVVTNKNWSAEYIPYGKWVNKSMIQPKISEYEQDYAKNVLITIGNSDKIAYFSNSFLNGYCMRGHHAIENISMFSDYIHYNYGRSGANLVTRWTALNSDGTFLGDVNIQDWGIKYGIIAMEENDVAMFRAEKESYYENAKKLAEAIKAVGGIPILGTEHDDSQLYYGLIGLAEEYGYMFMNWGKAAKEMWCNRFKPFWINNHPATRTAWFWSNGMKKYLDTLPRPEKSIKLFRLRSFVDTSDLKNLLYNNNGERSERFAEIHVGQSALTQETEKYFDRMDAEGKAFENVEDEYQKIQSGTESVNFGNYALIECITPFTKESIESIKIVSDISGVTNAYIKKNLNITIPYGDVTYVAFGVESGAELLTNGATFTVTGGVFSESLLGTYTVSSVVNGVVITTTATTGKTMSGTDQPVIDLSEVTLKGSYSAPSINYLNNFGKPFGAWSSISSFEQEGETDLSSYVSKHMDYDKISILLKGSNITISNVSFEVSGTKYKVRETNKKVTEWANGTSLIANNLLDDNTAWENINTVPKYTPVANTSNTETEGYPNGVTTVRILEEGESLVQSIDTSSLNQNNYAHDMLQIRIMARYFPKYVDNDSKWSTSEVNEDSFDCAKIGFTIGNNGKCHHEYVGAYWNFYLFNVPYIDGNSIRVTAINKNVQIARVDVVKIS